MDFFEIKDGTKKCNSTGDKTATVLTEGSFHLVYTNLSPLEMGILYLPNEVTMECEGTNSKLKGSISSSLNAAGTEITELTGVAGAQPKVRAQENPRSKNTTTTPVRK